jgi:hypothetical protein
LILLAFHKASKDGDMMTWDIKEYFSGGFCARTACRRRFSHRIAQIRTDKRKRYQNSCS